MLLAVVAHDFADGLNTVTFMLAAKHSVLRTASLLVLDAIAPIAGAMVATFIHFDTRIIAFQVSFFAGFLLYLGASDLLPHVHERPKPLLVLSTICGLFTSAVLVYAIDTAL